MHRLRLVHLACIPLLLAAAAAADAPPAGMLLWLKADSLGDASSTGGRVSLWRNSAADAHHAVQTESARQPVLVKPAAGPAMLEFDGVDDFLHLPDLKLGKAVSAFVVLDAAAQTTGGSAWRGVLCGDADAFLPESNQYAFALPQGERPRQSVFQAPPAKHLQRLLGRQLPEPRQLAIVAFGVRPGRPAGLFLRERGQVARKTVSVGLPDEMAGGYTLGQAGSVVAKRPGRFFRGQIAEVLVYDRVLREAEMLQVESYLARKYRLPSPPHPPLAGLEVWVRPDLCPQRDGPEVVQLSPAPVDGVGNEGLMGGRFVQPATDERPILLPLLTGASLRFEARSSLALEGGKPGLVVTSLAAVTDPAGGFRVSTDWPSLRTAGRLAGLCGDVHEVLGYARALASDEVEQAVRYLRQRHQPATDPRRFRNGRLVFYNGYIDQPYVVECRDGSWLCVMTTSTLAESGLDRTLVTCRSRDRGATWTEPVANIEPPLLQQPSWGTLLRAPSGRVFVFYNVKDGRADVPGRLIFCFRYSDDHGATWSNARYPLPLPRLPDEKPNQTPNGWSVCPPLVQDGAAVLAFTRFVPPGRSAGRGVVYRSANLLTEADAAAAGWQVLPADERALRSESFGSNLQEEHIVVPLAKAAHLYCIWRTEVGHPLESYSRDGGRTWSPPTPPRIGGDGPLMPQPVACTMPVALGNGRFLLWHHFSPGGERGNGYRPRSRVWLSAGEERSGKIVWSYPELLLYDDHLPLGGLGMSYPGFLVDAAGVTVLTTDKMSARLFRISPALLGGLWNQLEKKPVPLPASVRAMAGSSSIQTPALRDDGLTWQVDFRFAPAAEDQVLAELRQAGPANNPLGRLVVPAGSRTLRLLLWDRLGRCSQMDLSADGLRAGPRHRATLIVEGGAHLVIPLLDQGTPVDEKGRAAGWHSLPDDFAWDEDWPLTASAGRPKAARVFGCRVYAAALTVSQAMALPAEANGTD